MFFHGEIRKIQCIYVPFLLSGAMYIKVSSLTGSFPAFKVLTCLLKYHATQHMVHILMETIKNGMAMESSLMLCLFLFREAFEILAFI